MKIVGKMSVHPWTKVLHQQIEGIFSYSVIFTMDRKFLYQNATYFSFKKKYSIIDEIMDGEKGDKNGE